jgi:hypothetical protein
MSIRALLVCASLGGSAAGSPQAVEVPTDRAARLTRQAQALPDVAGADAKIAVEAALLVETEELPAELLVAIAWGESRFISSTVTGRACGPMQTIAWSRASCRAMQIPLVGFALGVVELKQWLRVARGDLRLALLGQACGWSAFREGCSKGQWPGWVLRRASVLGLTVARKPHLL